jgi:hypothetical protein
VDKNIGKLNNVRAGEFGGIRLGKAKDKIMESCFFLREVFLILVFCYVTQAGFQLKILLSQTPD